MLIRALTSFATATIAPRLGEVVEVPDALGAALVRAGHAEDATPAPAPAKKAPAKKAAAKKAAARKVETAAAPAEVETATV